MITAPPVISVVMPNLDGADYLQEAITSFQMQSYWRKELVVVDGRSRDGSHDVLRAACAGDPAVRWVDEPDTGISDAFLRGLAASTGDVVGFLGSDDLLLPGVLERVADLHRMADLDGVYFDSYTWWVPERRFVLHKPVSHDFSRESLLARGTLVGWQDVYFARHVYESHPPRRDLRAAMDYELLLRIAPEGYVLAYSEGPGTINRFGSGGASGANISRDLDGSQRREAEAVAAAYRGLR